MVCLRSIRKAGIEKHRFIHNETKLFECKLCYNKFKQYANIYRHYHLNHQSEEEQKFIKQGTPDDLKFQCRNCDKKFLTASLLQCHEKKEQNGKLFTNIAATNIKRRHGGITAALDVDYTCFFCPEKIKGMRNLVEHCQNVHNRTDEPNGLIYVKCMVCQKNVQKYSIDKHRMIHTETKPFECKLCYHKTSYNSNLLCHIRKNHQSEEEKKFLIQSTPEDLKFNCSICHLKFFTNSLLKYHNSKEHGKISNHGRVEAKVPHMDYTCFFCPEKINGMQNLVDHCQNVHNKADEQDGANHVKCMVCQKTIQKLGIVQHRTIHNATKLFECKLCYKKFSQYHNLSGHWKVHKSDEEKLFFEHGTTEDLKFKCKSCDLKFYTKSLLNDHEIKDHAFRTTISCEFCAREFSWKNRHNLKNHMRSIHGLDDYNVMDQALGRRLF